MPAGRGGGFPKGAVFGHSEDFHFLAGVYRGELRYAAGGVGAGAELRSSPDREPDPRVHQRGVLPGWGAVLRGCRIY